MVFISSVIFRHILCRNSHTDSSTGQFLAAGWSDGVVRLVGLESSKAVHHIRVGNGAASKIEYIAWSRNQTRRRSAEPSSTSQLPSRNILLDEEKDLLDLPHELEFLDVETALPKLSPLPVSGGSGYVTFFLR